MTNSVVDDLTHSEQREILDLIHALHTAAKSTKKLHVNVPGIIAEAMQVVEAIGDRDTLRGKFKKNLVVYITKSTFELCDYVINDELIDDTVEILLSASKNKFNLNTAAKCTLRYLPSLVSCCLPSKRTYIKKKERLAAEKARFVAEKAQLAADKAQLAADKALQVARGVDVLREAKLKEEVVEVKEEAVEELKNTELVEEPVFEVVVDATVPLDASVEVVDNIHKSVTVPVHIIKKANA